MKTNIKNRNEYIYRIMKLPRYSILAIFFAMGLSQPASAWVRGVVMYRDANLCVKADAAIDHSQPNTFSGNLAYADTYAFAGDCTTGLINKYAASKVEVYKWNGASWAVCRSSNWKYGYTGMSNTVGNWTPYGPGQILDYGGSASCGAGYYGANALAYVWDGSAWRGGALWSGYVYVP